MTKRNIFVSIISVSGIVLIAKMFGFIKQIVSANAFGATIQTDLISISEGLISNLDYLLVQALSTAYIPTYLAVKKDSAEDEKGFVSDSIKIFLLITICVSGIVFFASPVISKLLAPTYSTEISHQLASYIRVLSPVFILVTEMALFNSLLKANESFIPGELIGFNQSVICILLVFLFGDFFGADTLIIAFISYALFNLIFLMIYSRKYWSIRKGNPLSNIAVRNLLCMMGPLLLGYSLVFVNQQVDKIIVSGLGEGIVTAMSYAAVLSNFITTFVSSLCAILFTYITQHIVTGKDQDAAKLTMSSICQLVTILIPISILTIMNAKDIVSIVFGRGKFDNSAVDNCSIALIGYAFMFVPFVIRELLSRFQYGYRDSKKPMINSSISIVFNIVFSIVLSKIMGVLGVTLATSLSVVICSLLNYLSSRKKTKSLHIDGFLSILLRWTIGSTVCIAISLIGKQLLSDSYRVIRFVTLTFASLGAYALVAFPIIKPLIDRLRNKAV